MGIVGAVCGFFGQKSYDEQNEGHYEVASVAYHTLQLFVLHGVHLEKPVPTLLQVGRWLTAISVLLVVGWGLFKIFRAECLLIWARLHRGHVVICGLGQLGMRLADEFRSGGLRVVGIEASASAESLAAGEEAGFAVVTGDACNPGDLRKASVERAKQVIAVCDDEQTNVGVAAAVGKVMAASQARPESLGTLECWIFVPDVHLRETFQKEQVFPHTATNFRVNVRGLDPFELASRRVFDRSPLDFERIGPNDATVVHLIIVGFGPMGQHLALQGAEIGHFANFRKLKVTILEREGNPVVQEFERKYPSFKNICDVDVKRAPAQSIDLVSDLAFLLPPPTDVKELVSFAFCWDTSSQSPLGQRDMFQRLERDDPTNLRLALGLAKRAWADSPRFLVFQTRKDGFGALFPVKGRAPAIGPQMHAFGFVEDMYSLDTLLHEREDAIAKSLHQIWYENQIREGNAPGSKTALLPWNELPERFKDSNRQAADHIPVKLRAVGYRVDHPRDDQPPITRLEPSGQVELLAKMEHERWCGEKLLEGYVYGEVRDDVAKIQPFLVPWDKLTHQVQDYDRQQVRGIPDALARAGYAIYPQTL